MTKAERVKELKAAHHLALVNNDVPKQQLYRKLIQEHELMDTFTTNAVPPKAVLTKSALEAKTVPELREMAENIGVDTKGMLKADLVDTLANE